MTLALEFMNTHKTFSDYILQMPQRPTNSVAQIIKQSDQWRELNWQEYYTKVEAVAKSLIAFGIKPGDRIAVMAQTCAQWSYCDLAIIGLQAVTVPIYHNVTDEEFSFILKDCSAEVLFCQDDKQIKQALMIKKNAPNLKKIISFSAGSLKHEMVLNWLDFLSLGHEDSQLAETFIQHCKSAKPNQLASIIYTSGTTGTPKGVQISHEQILSEVVEAFAMVGLTTKDRSLSFLPYAHVLGRIEHWGHVVIGFTLAYAESIERLRINLPEVKPTVMVAVPRVFEKVYTAIISKAQTNPLKKRLFDWAIDIGKQVSRYKQERKTPPVSLVASYLLAEKLVLHSIQEAFGGQLRFAVCGGAPLSHEVAEFFHAADILILEGYGLTETTGAVCVNTPYHYRFGTVGMPIGDVKIRIANDGEVLLKSKKITPGYYNDEESTEKVFHDGWFATGDIGEILSTGELRITDRKKDLIKTAGGKYIAPQKLENLLKLSPLISHVLIHGDQKKYIVALLTLDRQELIKFAKEQGISYSDLSSLVRNAKVIEQVRLIIARANSELASFESIKNFKILPNDFTIEAGEITPSLKIKRKFVDQKYRSEIEAMY